MTEQEIRTILNRQREYFATGATLSRKFRAEQLGKLKASLQRHEEELNAHCNRIWEKAGWRAICARSD